MNAEVALGQMTRQALWDLSTAAADIGTYVLHLPDQDLEVDDRLLELCGLTRVTFSGRAGDVYANVHPDDVADVTARVEHAITTASSYSVEYRITCPSGELRWVAARGQVLTDQTTGAAFALVGAVYDVTEAREATARTATVLETMAVGYLSMDADWAVTYVNSAAEHIAQASRAELVGRSFWEAFPATVGTEFERSYRRVAETGQTVSFDAFYPQPLDVWVEVRATPEDGGGIALYFLDITDRHQAQESVERTSAQLAALGSIALSLAGAEQISDLVATIAEQGLPALGADGGSVAVPDPDDDQQLLSYITANFGEGTRADFGRLPLDAELPVALAARSGRRVLLGDQAACAAMSPHVLAANEATGCQAWASVPLRAGTEVIGVLTAGWSQPQTFGAAQVQLLETFAAQCAQALQRLQSRDAERRAAAAEQHAADLARTAAARRAGLVGIARSLADADAEDDVLGVVAAQGATLLPSSVWGLALRSQDGTAVRILGTEDIDQDVRTRVQHLPLDFALPIVDSAVHGSSHHLPDLAGTAERFPAAHELYAAVGLQASASIPLQVRGVLLGSLSVALPRAHTWTAQERDLLEAFAGLTAQALARIAAHEAERAALAAASSIAETLQRSMLTAPRSRTTCRSRCATPPPQPTPRSVGTGTTPSSPPTGSPAS